MSNIKEVEEEKGLKGVRFCQNFHPFKSKFEWSKGENVAKRAWRDLNWKYESFFEQTCQKFVKNRNFNIQLKNKPFNFLNSTSYFYQCPSSDEKRMNVSDGLHLGGGGIGVLTDFSFIFGDFSKKCITLKKVKIRIFYAFSGKLREKRSCFFLNSYSIFIGNFPKTSKK